MWAVPPPFHLWMAHLVEDMLHDARTGLTEAVVIVPGRAVLFYGRCSMGEGLTADKARDTAFLLTGACMWVGKSAYPAADPIIIQEGRRAIAQAISDHQVKARGPGHPHVNPPAQQPSGFIPQEILLWKMHLGMVVLIIHCHPISPPEAENVIGIRETKGLHHLCSPHLPQTVGLIVTRIHYWWLSRCCLGLTGQTDPHVPDKVDGIEMKELTWR